MREAACPVIVLPRSAGHVEEDSLFAEARLPARVSAVPGERVERLRRNHRDEIDSAVLYDAMASAEREERLAGVYRGLAAAERRHAARWAEQLEQLGAGRPQVRPRGRARVLAWLASPLRRVAAPSRRWPPASSSTVAATRSSRRPATRSATRNERTPAFSPSFAPPRPEGARPKRSLAPSSAAAASAATPCAPPCSAPTTASSPISASSWASRAPSCPGATILVTGIAGLLAGALSMAMGEWISVQSSRELYAHQIEVERLEIATMPELETGGARADLPRQGHSHRRGPRAGRADHARRGDRAGRDGP